MSAEQNLVSERVARGEATIDEIRTDLAERCAGIPYEIWIQVRPRFFLNLGIDHSTRTPRMPEEDWAGTTHRLNRNGTIVEYLVHEHKIDNGPATEVYYEFLHEVDEPMYRKYYSLGLKAIDELQKEIAMLAAPSRTWPKSF